MKVKAEDGKEHEEEVEIDTEKKTERVHVPKNSPRNEEADLVFDFKKVIGQVDYYMSDLPQSFYMNKFSRHVDFAILRFAHFSRS